ncbi:MAG: hypothetical protein CMA54_03220 [Euryarchaeota archaeon]|jgi:hypothetical protein|nr:hypothetical protein [Euryarchaeota archaeon]MDP7092414.1 hypothetical protein [Candidatus Thalassarchaeaceae archaeon]
MRNEALAAILAITLLMPIVAAHGANEYAFIMRGSSIQPSGANVVQNDSIVFYNVVDYNRTIRMDIDGDGDYDERCETAPSNSSSIKDECVFWIEPGKWEPGAYRVDVFSNGTLWKSLNLTIVHDLHEDGGPPSGYEFNAEENGDGSEVDGMEEGLRNLAFILFAASFIIWLARREGD